MRAAFLFAAAMALGAGLLAQPAVAHPYGPEDEHVNPSARDCDGDDWGSGGSPGYYADGRYYSSYPRRHHRRYRRYPTQTYGGYYDQAPGYGSGGGYGSAADQGYGASGGYPQTYPGQGYAPGARGYGPQGVPPRRPYPGSGGR